MVRSEYRARLTNQRKENHSIGLLDDRKIEQRHNRFIFGVGLRLVESYYIMMCFSSTGFWCHRQSESQPYIRQDYF